MGAVSQLPLLGEEWVSTLKDPDVPQHPNQVEAIANFRFVTPDYFKAMGIPLRMGRFLEEGDRGRPSAVISERAARFLWGNENPIGKHVRGVGPARPSLEVVGIVGDIRGKLEDAPPMMVYEHFWRMQPLAMSFVLRTRPIPLRSPPGYARFFPPPIRKWRFHGRGRWSRLWKGRWRREDFRCIWPWRSRSRRLRWLRWGFTE